MSWVIKHWNGKSNYLFKDRGSTFCTSKISDSAKFESKEEAIYWLSVHNFSGRPVELVKKLLYIVCVKENAFVTSDSALLTIDCGITYAMKFDKERAKEVYLECLDIGYKPFILKIVK